MNATARPDKTLEKARALHAQGRFDEALGAYEQALRREPGSRTARWGMTSILEMARSERYHPGLAIRFTTQLADPAANHQALARGAALQLRFRHGLDGEPDLFTLLPSLRRDPLLSGLLRRTINLDPLLERFLWRLRRHLLLHGEPGDLALAGALAQQCHNNEHAFPTPAEEIGEVERRVSRWLLAAPTPLDLAIVAMYRPLAELPQAEALLARPLGSWPGEIRDLMRNALHDGAEERRIAAAIPAFVPIVDEVSRRVRAMYEQNPYPRWLALPLLPRIDLIAELTRAYPALRSPSWTAGPLRLLSAGCGTGQHALSLAANYRGAEVTAFDLSRASIAYGAREAQRRGIGNIAFFHGDILSAPMLGRRFDVIESIGVIHHMDDPGAGLTALCATLEPGGLIRLGLYSEQARALIVAARLRISSLGLDGSAESIRHFRRLLLTDPAHADLAPLTDWDDFFTVSAARDLMFHVQEHRYDVPGIKLLLERCGLRFVGFEFIAGFNGSQAPGEGAQKLYAEAFPGDGAMADLDRWAMLERQHPTLFQGFTFWAQKPHLGTARPSRPATLWRARTMSAIFLDCLDEIMPIWKAIQRPGDPAITVNLCADQPADVPRLLAGHSIAINDHTYFDAALLSRCTDLKRIVFLGTGAASFIDLEAAAKAGIAVDTIKGYGDTTVAEHTIALMMASARGIARMDREVKAKAPWRQIEGVQLLGKTLGVIGQGGIGKEVARLGKGLGMKVMTWNRTPQPSSLHSAASLDEVLERSDVLCVCLLLNDATRGFIDRAKLQRTRQGVILINTARAAIIDQVALVDLLRSGHIRHAGIDVFAQEPPAPDDPLLSLENVTLTAHAGFMTPEATATMLRTAIDLTIAGGG